MVQGTDILGNLDFIKGEFENLKSNSQDVVFIGKVATVENLINEMQQELPKKIHQFTKKHCEQYISRIKEVKEQTLQLRQATNDVVNCSKIDFIEMKINQCEKKAENKLEEKIKK